MSTTAIVSAVLITLALAFYSLGVWAERVARYLRAWHVAAFWTGLVFDASGTYGMSLLTPGGIDWTSFHTLTGQLALWLMLAHALWATFVVWRGHEGARGTFHRFSLVVWAVWLVPYVGGAVMGMAGAR